MGDKTVSDKKELLKNFNKTHDFLVCIDSDGCAFDSMEVKHKECFAPNFINHWDLQAVAKQAREVWEFVNLYSSSRGKNRFQAVVIALDLLANRSSVRERGYAGPDLSSLRNWINKTPVLANSELEKVVEATSDPVLKKALDWSLGVNRYVEEIIRGVPPFNGLRPALEKAAEYADLMVVSATPLEALMREWEEHDLTGLVQVIAGQEMGTKADHIETVMTGRYNKHNVIKLGDAPGDLKSARDNGVLFYPIIPGKGEESWIRFKDEAFELFLNGAYGGEYEDKLIAEFEASLPDTPEWTD